ncbi:MAG: DUF1232 domain-containing protein [Deltaproteobacteria bacterium]|nr:DUF1232 domain-containing protein [Deltaproteobacteria bacterium]
MSDDNQYLEIFPTWLRSLGTDAEELAALLTESAFGRDAKEAVAGGINYLFKSLDLIPDGIDDIGYLDDAFVLRVAAEQASSEDLDGVDTDKLQILARLTNEAEQVRDFLGDDYGRLDGYVKGLRRGAARGRSVNDILDDEQTSSDFLSDVRGFAKTYESPGFAREEKNLIKLKAFFEFKLPG